MADGGASATAPAVRTADTGAPEASELFFSEAWLLTHVLTGAPPELVAELVTQTGIASDLPEGSPKKGRRRSRHPRSRKKVFPV